MSVKIMSAIFENEALGPTERLIMLALADHADDEGRCYPSVNRLCSRTGLKERAVRKNIRSLECAGYLTIHLNAGRNGSNLYFVRPTPAPDAPLHEIPPAPDAPTPCTKRTSTPAPDAPKPSGTIIEPSIPPVGPPQENASVVAPEAKPPPLARLPENWVPSQAGHNFALEKGLNESEIEELANEFRAYWSDRRDKKAKRSQRGWEQSWRNRVTDRLTIIIRNRRFSGYTSANTNTLRDTIHDAARMRRTQGEVEF